MKRIEGKLCLVTAAGQGIGRASAERLAAEGGRVIATDINDKALAELAAIDGIEARKLDVTDKAAITSLTKLAPLMFCLTVRALSITVRSLRRPKKSGTLLST